MKTYTITSPSIDGVLLDDHLYFEGVRRPTEFFAVRDGEVLEENNKEHMEQGESIDILEKYFHDIYNLFLRKLSSFATEERTTVDESVKLQALLQELIKVKGLIESASRLADERTAD